MDLTLLRLVHPVLVLAGYLNLTLAVAFSCNASPGAALSSTQLQA